MSDYDKMMKRLKEYQDKYLKQSRKPKPSVFDEAWERMEGPKGVAQLPNPSVNRISELAGILGAQAGTASSTQSQTFSGTQSYALQPGSIIQYPVQFVQTRETPEQEEMRLKARLAEIEAKKQAAKPIEEKGRLIEIDDTISVKE